MHSAPLCMLLVDLMAQAKGYIKEWSGEHDDDDNQQDCDVKESEDLHNS